MRPLKLTMQNFGPYQNETINFVDFNDTPLFLISGNTGAGKTTIFDAMCFALFGRTSGGERDGKQMRSEFAGIHDETLVEFTFEHQGKTFQIIRKPDQLQAKKRGEGTTNQTASVELTVFDHDEEVDQLIKIKTVENYLDELLHLTADQFMQIVLLPQGKFQNFLSAPSDEKERVLRDLFGTQFFDDWAQQLQAKNRVEQAKVAESKQQIAGLQGQLSWDADYLEQATPTTLTSELIDLQTEQQAVWQQALDQQKNELADLQKAAQTLQTKKTQQTALQHSLDQQMTLEGQLTELQVQQPKIDEVQKQIQALSWAKDQQALAERVQSAQQRLTANEQQIATLSSQATVLTQQVAARTTAVQELQQQQSEYDQLTARTTNLATQETSYQAVADLKQTVEKTEHQLAAQQTQSQELVAQQEQLTEQQAQAQKVVSQAEEITQQANHLAQEQATQQRLNKQLLALQAQDPKISQLQADVDQLVQKTTQQQTAVATAQLTVKQVESDWAAGQIAILAKQLIPGTPCPVCGSTEHPAPAAVTTVSITEAEVEAAKQALTTAQADLNQLNVQLSTKQTELKSATEHQNADQAALIEELQTNSLGLPTAPTLADLAQSLADWQKRLTIDSEANGTAQQQLTIARQQVASLKTKLATLTNQLTTTSTQIQQQQADLAGMRGQLETKQAALPSDFADLTALQAYLKLTRQKIATFKAALDQANQALNTAQGQQTTNQGQLNHAQSQLQQQQTELQTSHQELVAQVQAYLHTNDLGQLDSLLGQIADLPDLQQQFNEFHTKLTTVNSQLQLLAKEINGQAKPDLAATETALTTANQAVNEANEQYVTLQQRLKTNQNLVAQIQAILAKQAADAERLSQLNQLAQTATGNNPQRLSLERYVLQTYLERVLDVANSRLDKLTAHRYQFCLDEGSGRGRKTTGLEIDVYDDPAGKVRSVHTLSGGESFIAALSLALALGEVIQNQAGGIQIDALFVDEGFGSLDQNALDTAIEALKTIEGQNRVIGIISHVTELKARIPDQLQVVADGNGHSHTKIQVN